MQSSRTSERGESLDANTRQLTCNHMSTASSTASLLLLQYHDTKNWFFFVIVIVNVFLLPLFKSSRVLLFSCCCYCGNQAWLCSVCLTDLIDSSSHDDILLQPVWRSSIRGTDFSRLQPRHVVRCPFHNALTIR